MMDKKYILVAIALIGLMFNPVNALTYCPSSWQYEINNVTGWQASNYARASTPTSVYEVTTGTIYYARYSGSSSTNYTGYLLFNNSFSVPSGFYVSSAIWNIYSPDGDPMTMYLYNCPNNSVGTTNLTWNYRPLTSQCYNQTTLTITNARYFNFNVTNVLEGIRQDIAGYGRSWYYTVGKPTEDLLFSGYGRSYALTNLTRGSYWCYNLSTSIFLTTMSIASPSNTTYNSTNSIWANFTPTNNALNATTCFRYLDSVETALGNITNGSLSSTNLGTLAAGNHNIYFKCANSDSSYSNSSTIYFKINLVPTVTLINLETDYAANNSNVEVAFNTSDTDNSNLSCVVTIDSTPQTAFTVLTGLPVYVAYGGIADGDHNLSITCTDSYGGSGTDSDTFSIERGYLNMCFYTYNDYYNYISNNSITAGNTPNALRPKVLFNDSLGSVWAVQNFHTLAPNYYYSSLVNGCASIALYSTGRYTVFIADNTNFDSNGKPTTSNPRYYEGLGDFAFTVGGNLTTDRFISFEDGLSYVSDTQSGDTLISSFRQLLYFAMFAIVIVGGAYLGAVSGGAGIAVLAIIGIGIAVLLLFKDFILSGGLI